MAGQEGFEPTTSGFGDRRSTNSSYWPVVRTIWQEFPCHCGSLHRQHRTMLLLSSFSMDRVRSTSATELLDLQSSRSLFLVFGGRVVSSFAVGTLQQNDVSHLLDLPLPASRSKDSLRCYSRISVMVPAPTVRPPSRIANLSPFSIAIGVINSISILTLSPGITISVPSPKLATPVTSVVRK